MNKLDIYVRKLFTDFLLTVSDYCIGCASYKEVNEVKEMKHFILQTMKLMDDGCRVALLSPGGFEQEVEA